jgi:dihydroorotate dehydrogenase
VSTAAWLARRSLPLLQRLEPERAHDVGLSALKLITPLLSAPPVPGALARSCFGVSFTHPLGLAAGFDKNGDYIDALGRLGFSHLELGTVTPRPQPGNPRPRMFRVPAELALINRMGFNNSGVDHLVARLEQSRFQGVRGVSIGKNADTPLERAAEDYVHCFAKVYPHADYVAVNVSSPNTARLRELQEPASLERIVEALLRERARLEPRHGRRVPVLVKIAPDLDEAQVRALAAAVRSLGVDGLIATNTTSDHAAIAASPVARERGGLSGAPLRSRSIALIAQLANELGPGFPLIGVGGIVSAGDARAMLAAGAHLIQVWTGFAYRGPALIDEILSTLEHEHPTHVAPLASGPGEVHVGR